MFLMTKKDLIIIMILVFLLGAILGKILIKDSSSSTTQYITSHIRTSKDNVKWSKWIATERYIQYKFKNIKEE